MKCKSCGKEMGATETCSECYGNPFEKPIRKALVFDLNYMGDMLMSSPVMRALKENGVEQVDVIAYDFCVEILRGNPYIDNIYPVKRFALGEAIAAMFRKYDLILQLNTSLKTNILMWIAGGKERLGYNYKWKGFGLTIKVPISHRTATKGYRPSECLQLLEKGLGWTCERKEMIYDACCD